MAGFRIATCYVNNIRHDTAQNSRIASTTSFVPPLPAVSLGHLHTVSATSRAVVKPWEITIYHNMKRKFHTGISRLYRRIGPSHILIDLFTEHFEQDSEHRGYYRSEK